MLIRFEKICAGEIPGQQRTAIARSLINNPKII
jgi:ABC-type lipoprotein export system ATPase subunit